MTNNKRTVVIDIEANSLRPDKIWCVVAKDVNNGEVFKFRPNSPLSGHVDFKDDVVKFVEECETFIGHNLLGYDIYYMNKLLGTDIKVSQVIDTLVWSRLFRPVSPFKERLRYLKTDDRVGGHSLEAWGVRLGYPKIEFNDWSKFSEEMLEYCVGDVELNHKVYEKLLLEKPNFSDFSINLEQRVAWYLAQQERNGFYLNQKKAQELYDTTSELLEKALEKLQELFPPVPKITRENYEVKYTKAGEVSKVSKRIIERHANEPNLTYKLNSDGTYNFYRIEEYNPQSSKQTAERLLSLGWTPRKFTGKGNPSTDKDTLSEAIDEIMRDNPDFKELQYLKNYNIIADRNQKAEKWLSLVEEDGRVHGSINPIGAGTHRCSHFNDNMANIASVSTTTKSFLDYKDVNFKTFRKFDRLPDNNVFLLADFEKERVEVALTGIEGQFGWESRECWAAPSEDKCIVGADASGIQLRALAHYMNDEEYTKNLLEGDIHTVNQHAAGIDDRPTAKTFIYAWLLGAGDEKIGVIVKTEEREFDELFAWAKNLPANNYHSFKDKDRQNLFAFIMDSLRKQGRKATKKTMATVIKGFKIKRQFLDRTPALKRLRTQEIPSVAKKGKLTGIDGRTFWIPNEHLAMSFYLQGFEAVIMKLAMCYYHKDLESRGIPFKQVAFVHDEFQIETEWKYAQEVGQSVVNAIRLAGEHLKSNCPLDGDYKVGRHWAQTH